MPGPASEAGITDRRTDDEVVAEVDEERLLLFAPELGSMCCEAAERERAAGAHRILRAARALLTWSELVPVRRWGEGRFRELAGQPGQHERASRCRARDGYCAQPNFS